jgi:haloalkane dehalogenase
VYEARRPHVTIDGAGHFLQEDRGAELAEVVVRVIGDAPMRRAD